jgi:hypothetical protein
MDSSLLLLAALSIAGQVPSASGPALTPAPKVPLAFNRLYNYPELVEAMRDLERAHPSLLTMHSLGKSVEGRDLWCMTINNPRTGSDAEKPAMYVDGNIHGNEVQGGEVCLYLIWYLAENYGRVENVTRLVDERAFYVVPTVNPDGRAHWFEAPNTTHSSRGGKSPIDDDRDGVADEDGYDDLDGDGQITQMRRRDPRGRWKIDPDDPRRLVPCRPDEDGEFELLGLEGIDNDGDGQVNEDGPGYYDMNRNWPADWQPQAAQSGAGPYPLCWPETRAVAEFLRAHPNVAGVQAFHNYGGMILRGPGHPSRQAEYPAEDERVASQLGAAGERMLPFYRSMIIHKDLYEVHGGFIGWTYEHLGIFSFTNELYNGAQLLGQGAPGSLATGAADAEGARSRDRLLLNADLVAWHPASHPTYGEIEIGGAVKQSQRVPPMFLLEELCHRNAAFVIYHADQMPRLEWHDVGVERLGPETFAMTASVRNTRLIPSRAAQAARRRLGVPDEFGISGEGMTVLAGGRLASRFAPTFEPAEGDPARIRLEEGVGSDPVFVRWIVRGAGEATLTFRAQKSKALSRSIDLAAQH